MKFRIKLKIGKQTRRVLLGLVAITIGFLTIAATVLLGIFRASLPQIDGAIIVPAWTEIVEPADPADPEGDNGIGNGNGKLPGKTVTIASGLRSPLTVTRDAWGVPTITGDRLDEVMFGLGFVHGQDRFFQMDLTRRAAAGELSEVFGELTLEEDKRLRHHRFRSRARTILSQLPQRERILLQQYAAGVNAAMEHLGAAPWEYHVLRVTPEPWRPEDSLLAVFAMYLMLQKDDWKVEETLDLLRDTLPPALADCLSSPASGWEAPMLGEPQPIPPLPSPEQFRLRAFGNPSRPETPTPTPTLLAEQARDATDSVSGWFGVRNPECIPGSNNWAVAGSRTADGKALLSNDMHMGPRVPALWYRALLVWNDPDGKKRRAVGATLPGGPALVAGGNGHIAWGLTNSCIDTSDIINLDIPKDHPETYLSPEGPREFVRFPETIAVRGGVSVEIEVEETHWGPRIENAWNGQPRALCWTVYDTKIANLEFLSLIAARTRDEALRIAHITTMPHQNFVVVDDQGRIAWTIMGRIPRRTGWDGTATQSWSDGKYRWDGYLNAEEVPAIVDPPEGLIWTANNRVVTGGDQAKLAGVDYDLGARAQRIRDRLRELKSPTTEDMLKIQLDDRVVFLDRWRQKLLDTLTPERIADPAHPLRAECRRLVEEWNGRATMDAIGYPLVRTFRSIISNEILKTWTDKTRQRYPSFDGRWIPRREAAIWEAVSQQPLHLLHPHYPTWDDLLLEAVDRTCVEFTKEGRTLAETRWGQFNKSQFKHPLSKGLAKTRGLGWLTGYLDFPEEPLNGAPADVPRIQSSEHIATQRITVTPGAEERGYFQMPCGQSGHPGSPHYRDGHAAWKEGWFTPLLPGPPVASLQLTPKASQP